MRDSKLAVRLRGAQKAFGARVIMDELDLDIEDGAFVALLGKSGCGKTTLLRVLAGLDALDDGEVLVPTVRTTVFQEPRLVPSKRALANVLLGQRRNKANTEEALAALQEVGLGDHTRNWPSTLSGGEAQRVALARALVRKPGLLLLDEPFAALDALTRLTMHDLVTALHQRYSPAALIVTHDVDESITLADRVLVLTDGRISLDLPVDIPRPRDRTDPRFVALGARLRAELGVGGARAEPALA